MKPSRLQQGTREAIDLKLSSVFLAALADVQANRLTKRESDALRERLSVGRASEQRAEPLLRRAAIIAEIRSPGITTVAAFFHAASRDDIKALDETLKAHAASTDAAEARE